MNKLVVKCPAKINLFLNIVGKQNNMHLLNMLNNTVDLYDYLDIEIINNDQRKITLTCDNLNIPVDSKNSVYKALDLMMKKYNINASFKVNMYKNIPLEAGLGGESTDAAGLIYGINKLCNLQLSLEEMQEIGALIGADVPYCLHGGPCIVNGIGEKIIKTKLDLEYFVIIKPDFSMNTKDAFKKYDELVKKYEIFDEIIIGHNDFEKVIPDIQLIKDEFFKYNPYSVNMTGSGTAVVASFLDYENYINCYKNCKKKYQTWKVRACNGIEFD